jgi:hypothetical protein
VSLREWFIVQAWAVGRGKSGTGKSLIAIGFPVEEVVPPCKERFSQWQPRP